MFAAFVLVIVIYFWIILVSQQSGIDTGALKEGAFPAVGVAVGGKWLGDLIALAGMASSFGIYAAVLLSVSRVPKAMADDGLLPNRLNRLHTKFETPYVSIIVLLNGRQCDDIVAVFRPAHHRRNRLWCRLIVGIYFIDKAADGFGRMYTARLKYHWVLKGFV